MIITCPDCSMRYLVATSSIGDEGREVRCANCNHQWFQEPKEAEEPLQEDNVAEEVAESPAAAPVLPEASDGLESEPDDGQEQEATEESTESLQDEEKETAEEGKGEDTESQIDADAIEEVSGKEEGEDAEEHTEEESSADAETSEGDPLDPEKDLPEALSGPIEDDHILATPEALEQVAALEKKKMIVGAALAAGVFALVIGTLVVMKDTVIKAMPSAIAFYESYGMRTPVPGTDLIFDQLQAIATRDQEGVNNLKITGKIMNISEKDSVLPPILIALRSEEEKTTESWVVYPKEEGVPGAGSVEFDSAYPELADETASVNVSFFVGKQAEDLAHKEGAGQKKEANHSTDKKTKKDEQSKEKAHKKDDSHKDDGHGSDH